MRPRLSYANVVATLALFVALGGSSYAAVQLSKGNVKKKHIAKNAVVSKKVKDGSLLSEDFKPGELVAGAPGPQGERGERGPAGSPDTPAGVLGKVAQVDGAGSGLDADLLDGQSLSQIVKGGGHIRTLTETIAAGAERDLGSTEDGIVTFQCRPYDHPGPRVFLYNYWQPFEGVFRKGTAGPDYFWQDDSSSGRYINLASADFDQLTLQTTLGGKATTVTVSSVDWTSSCFVAMQMVSAE